MPDSWLAERRQPRDSLATRIIFFVFVSTLFTALVVSWVCVQSTYAFLREHLQESYGARLSQHAEGLLRDIFAAQGLLEHLAAEVPLAAATAGHEPPRATLEQRIREHLEAAPALAALWLRDAGGRVWLRVGAAMPPAPEDAARPVSGVEVVADRLVVSLPLQDERGAPAGTLAGILLTPFSEQTSSAPLPEGIGVYLVDGAGHVLLAGGDPTRFDALPAAAGRAAPGALFEFRGADNRRGVGARHPLPFADWSLVAAQPLERAYASVSSVLTQIFVIDLAVVLLFSFLAYEITAAIVRPLVALSDAARRISQGELEVEIADTRKHDEIGLLTRTFNDMARRLRRNHAELDQQHRQLREQNEQLQQANEVLEQLSITDGLTKLHNHRYFQEALTREIKRVTRTAEPLAILLVDIDDFKALNDRLGHAAGDAVLVRIARILNESVRESDVLARYGGEEFVALATGTDLAGALFLAEKVRTAVAESSFGVEPSGESMHLTVSVGVAEFAGDRRAFFDAADRALYRAKAAGKNCVVSAEDPLAGGA